MLGEARFATTRRITGAERTVIQQITRNDPSHGWAARGIDGPIRPNATITVERLMAAPGHESPSSRLRMPRNRVPLLPLARRQAHKGAPNSYRNLKDRSNTASELMPRI